MRRLVVGGVVGVLLIAAAVSRSRGDDDLQANEPFVTPFADALEVTVPPVLLEPPKFVEPFFPFFDDEDASRSISVGDTSHGFVVNAKEVKESDALGILPRQKARDLAWGSDEIVAMIEKAANDLHAATGTRLWIGDVGRRGGGDIVYSVSHNSGRDADIALAYTDPSGKPVDPPDLIRLLGKGESKDGKYRLDAAREWRIVKSLLTFEGAQVQYLFLAGNLKMRLVEWAEIHHEPADVLARAIETIVQPASPHDDHLHLRIYCTSRDLAGGCLDTGVVHPFTKMDHEARPKEIELAAARLDDPKPSVRRTAIQRLAMLDANDRADLVAKKTSDASPDVRAAAVEALGRIGAPEHAEAVFAATLDADVGVKLAALGALRMFRGKSAGSLIADALAKTPPACGDGADAFDPFAPPPVSEEPCSLLDLTCAPQTSKELVSVACEDPLVRGAIVRAAIDAAGYADRLEPVDPLLDVLANGAPEERVLAADALARVTNASFKTVEGWRGWIDKLRRSPRDAWLAAGFTHEGYGVPRIDKKFIWELVRALARGDHLAYNAHRSLLRLTERKAPWLRWGDQASCGDWLSFVASHTRELEVPGPPDEVVHACAHPND